jgi:hypothetical protein
MSLILDALQRAQREPRSRDDVPGVDSLHIPGQHLPGGWRRALPWIALAVALAAVGGLLWERRSTTAPVDGRAVERKQQSGTEPPGATAAAPTPGNAQHIPAGGADSPAVATRRPAPMGTPAATPSVVETPVKSAPPSTALPSPEPAVVALYERSGSAARETVVGGQAGVDQSGAVASGAVASGAVASGAVASGAAPGDKPVAPAPVSRGGAAVPDRAQSADDSADEAVGRELDIDSLIAVAESELAQSKLSEHPSPFLSDLSQVDKDAVPTIYYSRHEYNKAGGSTVILNGKSLTPGDAAGGGVRVEEILEDSVVLSHHGVEFRLKALNSWVNL